MKRSVTIGIALSAGWLFANVPRTGAQDDQVLRYRQIQAQTTPSNLPAQALPSAPGRPILRPQMSSPALAPQMRPSQMMQGPPLRSATPLPSSTPRLRKTLPSRRQSGEPARQRGGIPVTPANVERPTAADQKARSAAISSPARQNARKSRRKSDARERSRERNDQAERIPESSAHNSRQPPVTRPEAGRAIPVPMHALPVPPPAAPPPAPPQITHELAPPAAPLITPQTERSAPVPAQPAQAPVRSQRPILSDLSEDERARLHSAHQAALHDPNLAASRTRYLNARKEFRDRLHNALLKADPSVQPILEKIRKDKPDDH